MSLVVNLEISPEPSLFAAVCDNCLGAFANWAVTRVVNVTDYIEMWDAQHPFLAALRSSLCRERDRLDNDDEYRSSLGVTKEWTGSLSAQWEAAYDRIDRIAAHVSPPDLNLRPEWPGDFFNEWLLTVHHRLTARLTANKPMERCQAVHRSVNTRCDAWAEEKLGDVWLCHHHADMRRKKGDLWFRTITEPDLPIIHYFPIAASGPDDLKAQLVKFVPIEWLAELGVVPTLPDTGKTCVSWAKLKKYGSSQREGRSR